MSYRQSHDRSIADPSAFWAEQAGRVAWYPRRRIPCKPCPTAATVGSPMAA